MASAITSGSARKQPAQQLCDEHSRRHGDGVKLKMLDRVGALLLLLLASRSARATPAHTSPPIPVTGWHATGWCAGMPDCASCAADMSCAWCASAGKCMGIDAANTGAAVCKRWDDATCSSTAKAAVEPPADVEEEGGLCHWCVTHGRGGCFSTTKPLQGCEPPQNREALGRLI